MKRKTTVFENILLCSMSLSLLAGRSAGAEESDKVQIKTSGFAWVEQENSANFGYNGSSGVSNFDSTPEASKQSFASMLANFQIDVSKGKTTLVNIFEVGEVVGGETTTGGAQGSRQRILEVRDLYLAHEFSAEWSAKAGIVPLASDPNSFILADHHSALVLEYKDKGWAGSLWTAKAKEVKPGSTPSSTPINVGPPVVTAGTSPIYADTYAGFSLASKFTDENKVTGFGVYRRTKESLNDDTGASILGASEYNWLGATADVGFSETYSAQLTGILNNGKFTGDAVGSVQDTYSAQLLDAKLGANWASAGLTLSLEGLATSGSTDGMGTAGRRKAFASPNPGCAYILTIATSDGADDSPGSLKESVIGNLGQGEGLRIGVLKLNKSFGEKVSSFVRFGVLNSAAANSVTKSTDMGQEFDANLTYEFAPGTLLQLDYGYLKPGSFYAKTEAAQLLTTRVKFSF